MGTTGTSLNSKLKLVFAASAETGVTRLTHRQAGGLCHIGKPYWDGQVLLTQLINPTAGLFSGDRLAAEIELGSGTSVLLSNPSATRLHTMERGSSEMHQVFRLEAGSFLEVHPELLIPQADSEATIQTRFDLQGDASLVFLDLLAPGRKARGESMAWRQFNSGLDIFHDGELMVRERARLAPPSHAWRMTTPSDEDAYVATLWLKLPKVDKLSDHLHQIQQQLEHPGLSLGFSELAPGLAVVRLVTTESVLLRQTCERMRQRLANLVPQLRSRTGKL